MEIQIPISEEDIRMFEELVKGDTEPFTWTFYAEDELGRARKVDVTFSTDKEEE